MEAEAYVGALLRERDLRFYDEPWSDNGGEPVWNTAYIGGGTPSVLPIDLLRKVIGIAHLIPGAEYTIEANPEQVDGVWLDKVRDAGINRVSMGIQSFTPQLLDAVGRNYRNGRAQAAIEALAASGLSYSVDLIYGLPGQSVEHWQCTLRQMLSFRPPHFSAYLLSYEPGTRLHARMIAGKVEEATEEVAEEMYGILCREAHEAGYEHYEVSNFALPGFHARHNSSYWDSTPYLGLGCSAHSFDGTDRASNPASVSDYIRNLSHGRLPLEKENETDLDRLNDSIITSLRTARGFLLPEDAPEALVRAVQQHLSAGTLTSTSEGRVFIPEAMWLRSDAIMRDLIQI